MRARASIMVVGSEILKGITLDTNSNWLAKKLTGIGFEVARILAVPDDAGEIEWGLKALLEFSDVVVATGGLGFTEDDITSQAIARALGLGYEFNDEAYKLIEQKHGEDAVKYVKAAYMPSGAKPIPNNVGVSPGFIVEWRGKKVIALPGVPVEMKEMFERYVEPLLQSLTGRISMRAVVVTNHMVEAEVDELVRDLRKLEDVYVKTHAEKPVKITIVAYGSDVESACATLERVIGDVSRRLNVKSVEKPPECSK